MLKHIYLDIGIHHRVNRFSWTNRYARSIQACDSLRGALSWNLLSKSVDVDQESSSSCQPTIISSWPETSIYCQVCLKNPLAFWIFHSWRRRYHVAAFCELSYYRLVLSCDHKPSCSTKCLQKDRLLLWYQPRQTDILVWWKETQGIRNIDKKWKKSSLKFYLE